MKTQEATRLPKPIAAYLAADKGDGAASFEVFY